MAKRRRKKALQRTIKSVLAIICVITAFFVYKCYGPGNGENGNYEIPEGSVEFHFIDIGQGDAELILVDDKAILIDTGNIGSDYREKLTGYLEKLNITELEYFIATHPDSDHIGSAAYVVENYDINNVIMSPKEHTSKTYLNFISALEEKENINVINAQDKLGECIYVGELELKILGPIGDVEKLDNNNASVVIMARWGNTKVLLTGDAEKEAEDSIVGNYAAELDCDVLKVGHHGSHSSSQRSFIRYAKPEYAIISCGADNDYGHPHDETLSTLEYYNVEVHRTDLEGSIVVTTDGEKITIKSEKSLQK
ncbi:MAG: MBL fold metallo-hydrolase [Clostridia bacterium]|nr:MBL fold metallo-hydrolase [Clostridia bacterium]